MNDLKLTRRVKEFLRNSDVPLQRISAEYVADELRDKYSRDYSRKPKIPFQIVINKILKNYMKEIKLDVKFKSSKDDEFVGHNGVKSMERPHSFCNLNNLITNNFKKLNQCDDVINENHDNPKLYYIDTLGSKPLKSSDEATNDTSVDGNTTLVDNKVADAESRKTKKSSKVKCIKNEAIFSNYEILKTKEKFSDLVGMNDILTKLKSDLWPFNKNRFHLCPRGILISGPSGCGKSMLARSIATELGLPMINVASVQLMAGVATERDENVQRLFQQAINMQPCIILIDNIDLFTGNNDNNSVVSNAERHVLHHLLKNIDDLNILKHKVWLIGLARKRENVDSELLRGERFVKEFHITLPDASNRSRLLKMFSESLVQILKAEQNGFENKEQDEGLQFIASNDEGSVITNFVDIQLKDINFEDLGHKTPSYSGLDLKKLAKEAILCSFRKFESRSHGVDSSQQLMHMEAVDFEEALRVIKPTTMVEDNITIPEVTWKNIGALQNIRDKLLWLILFPIKYPKLMEECGLSKPEGVMLFGPPGCGKTLVAKALANEASLNFLSVKGPELINKYVGESERNIRSLFQRAKECSPCLIFFDEIDSISERRSSHSEGGGIKVVQQLLTELDGVQDRDGVFVMGATNRLDCVDPAFLRENRFSTLLYVGLPSADGRLEILQSLTKSGTIPRMADDVNLQMIANDDRCTGFNGADLLHLIKTATRFALLASVSSEHVTNIIVTKENFEMAISEMEPSVSSVDLLNYEKMARKFNCDKSKMKRTLLIS